MNNEAMTDQERAERIAARAKKAERIEALKVAAASGDIEAELAILEETMAEAKGARP
jgi:hypothetical protein